MSPVEETGARKGNRNVLVTLAVVVLVVALGAAVWLANRKESSGMAPTPRWSSQEATSAEAPSATSTTSMPTSPSVPTSTPSTQQQQLEADLTTKIAGYEPELTSDPEPVERGAEAAVTGVFTGGNKTLAFASSDWPSTEAALEYVQAQAAAEFTNEELLKSGDVGQPPRGQYWYYERDGSEGVVYWVVGNRAFRAAGPPSAVQGFFVQFPAS